MVKGNPNVVLSIDFKKVYPMEDSTFGMMFILNFTQFLWGGWIYYAFNKHDDISTIDLLKWASILALLFSAIEYLIKQL